jgi:hypothetical protein
MIFSTLETVNPAFVLLVLEYNDKRKGFNEAY